MLDDKISEYASNPFDLYIILLSIKNIKQISDIYGIIEGEKAITKVAESLEHLNLQNNYHVARYNSGGFIIVCEYIGEQELKDFCNKTRSILNKLSVDDELKIQYGLGVKKYENPNISVNEFLMQADANLYLGKTI